MLMAPVMGLLFLLYIALLSARLWLAVCAPLLSSG